MKRTLALVLVLATAASSARAQQAPDTTFDVSVASAAFPRGAGPRLLVDEAHHNFHTAKGRYRPFADLVRNDGFKVVGNVHPFSTSTLVGISVLVISNAMGAEDMGDSAAATSAFSPDEIAAVKEWVTGGGGLLLIADHSPFGGAASKLAEAFGVEMRDTYTLDPKQRGPGRSPGILPFDARHGLDTTHAVVRGSAPGERVRRVVTFTGQSLLGPAGSSAILQLPKSAQDHRITPRQLHDGMRMEDAPRTSARGRAQAVALRHGRGRVLVLGEAAMLTAQRVGPDGAGRMGMNAGDNDNKQFALNAVRWLAGVYR